MTRFQQMHNTLKSLDEDISSGITGYFTGELLTLGAIALSLLLLIRITTPLLLPLFIILTLTLCFGSPIIFRLHEENEESFNMAAFYTLVILGLILMGIWIGVRHGA